MPEAVPTPPPSPRPPSLLSRLVHRLRFFRVFRRKSVCLPIVAALLVGIDAWIYVAINGWEDDSKDLLAEATTLGESIGANNASIEEAGAEILMLDEQQTAAALRADELADEAAAEQALSDAMRDVALDLEKCATDRLKVVRGLWEHGRGYVAALDAQANSECDAAQATLNHLIDEVD